jgi:hypothetical protein
MFPYVADVLAGTTNEVHSSLEVFKVDTTAGFTKLAAISHDDFFNSFWWQYCSDMINAGMRRGLFISDNIYSISFGGIKVHAMTDLSTPVKSVSLSSPAGLGMQCALP